MRSQYLILGLGSNLGQPIENLRQALSLLKNTKGFRVLNVASFYESDALVESSAPESWRKNFLNSAVLIEIDSLASDSSPENILKKIKLIEKDMGRADVEKWAPRLIDIDILWMSNTHHQSALLQVPHAQLFERPFALLPALELRPELRQSWSENLKTWAHPWVDDKPFNTRISQNAFWPRLVGVLNLTEDSFSDGGRYLNADRLIEKARNLMADGAEILDLGAESTRPRAHEVSAEEELSRLQWGLGELSKAGVQAKISVDSRRAEVLEPLLESYRIDFINDVSGFADPQMQKLLSRSNARAFVMHSLGVPPTAQTILPSAQKPQVYLLQWWHDRRKQLLAAGVEDARLIFDPGIGFGKSKFQSIEILNHLEELAEITNDVLIGHSRKSFMTVWTTHAAAERDSDTALITQNLNQAFVQYLRLHEMTSQKAALAYRGYRG